MDELSKCKVRTWGIYFSVICGLARAQAPPLTISIVPVSGHSVMPGETTNVEVFLSTHRAIRLEGGQFDLPCIVHPRTGGTGTLTIVNATADPDEDGILTSSNGTIFAFGTAGLHAFQVLSCVSATVPGIGQPPLNTPDGATRYLGTITLQASLDASGLFDLDFECTDRPGAVCDAFLGPMNTTRYREDQPPGMGLGPLIPLELTGTTLRVAVGRCCRASACLGEMSEAACEARGGTLWEDSTTCKSGCPPCGNDSDCRDDAECTLDQCNIGMCLYPPAQEGTPCDDQRFCTAVDRCVGGVCQGEGDPCPEEQCSESLEQCVECLFNQDCDDENDCTSDTCNVLSGACTHAFHSASCDDGLFCTVTDRCQGGVCRGSPRVCPGGFPCDEEKDACVPCLADADCEDQNDCTRDRCNQEACLHEPLDQPCDDGRFCTANDRCVNGTCLGADSPCTSPNALRCDESQDRCTECLNAGHCNDNNPCTTDVCSAVSGTCENSANSNSCNDDLFCTVQDRCMEGMCIGVPRPCPGGAGCDEKLNRCRCGEDADCDDGNPCTADRCVSANCVYGPDPGSLPCDDGLFCTAVDHCENGVCRGVGDPCPADMACHETQNACVPPDATLSLVPIGGTLVQSGNSVLIEAFFTAHRILRIEGGIIDVACDLAPQQGSFGGLVGIGGCSDCDGDGRNESSAGIPFLFGASGLNPHAPDSCATASTPGIGAPTVQLLAGAVRYLGTFRYNVRECSDGAFHVRFECSDQPGGICVGTPEAANTTRFRADDPPAPTQGPLLFLYMEGVTLDVFAQDSCDDGLSCTTSDECVEGACIGGGIRCPGLYCSESLDGCVACLEDHHCDDGNVCTTDSCIIEAGVCQHDFNSKPCNDGLYCTKPDTCVTGVCVGTRRKCPAGLVCDEDEDRCVAPGR